MKTRLINYDIALKAFNILESIAEESYEQEVNGALIIHGDALDEINHWYIQLLESENESK